MVAKVYPALKLNMGSEDEGWVYYAIKMRMRDVATSIGFAEDFEENKTLDNIYQRARSSRAKNEMVRFLANREDRFYSSIVVAARGGAPTFAEIKPENDEQAFFYDGNGDYGILKFDGGENYYALDGQHRVTSIQTLLDTTEKGRRHLDNIGVSVPEGFKDESVSVIIVTTSGNTEAWRKKFRRLFSALNRNAKPVDKDTIIAMDEDDLFAIVTRQLIQEHEFFFWDGAAADNEKILCKGKNIKSFKTGRGTASPAAFFTSLQTLYAMNYELLKTTINETDWKVDSLSGKSIKIDQYKQNRPSDEDIDKYYLELSNVWTALLDAVPDLKNKDPKLMRTNNADNEDLEHKEGSENNALFRPLVQEEILAPIARTLLNDDEAETYDEMVDSLSVLSKVEWSLFEAPWRHLILTKNENDDWSIASEDRSKRIERCNDIIQWIVGLVEKDDEDIAELKAYYQSYLNCPEDEQEALWKSIEKNKSKISRN